jgi:TolA-binding protein
VYVPKDENGNYSLAYSQFVVPLVKAVQELSKMNDEKDARIDELQKQNNALEKRIERLEAMMNWQSATLASSQSTKMISITDASLEQNIPNPFTNTTTINYTLPKKFTTAQILISDRNGKVLKQVNVSGTGKGTLNVKAATLSSGTYDYSLIVDGRVVSTKQMLLAR